MNSKVLQDAEMEYSVTPVKRRRAARLMALYQQRPAIFNPMSKRHLKHLEEWCQLHWKLTFLPQKKHHNALFFHYCCDCFSRRRFCELAGHDPEHTIRISKLPSFKNINSGKELFKWLNEMLLEKTSRGELCYFPAINRYHYTDQGIDLQDETDANVETLRKRCEMASLELVSMQAAKRSLEITNQQLLSSSKNWYNKYQDLLEKHAEEYPPEFYTPQKQKPLMNFGCFEEFP